MVWMSFGLSLWAVAEEVDIEGEYRHHLSTNSNSPGLGTLSQPFDKRFNQELRFGSLTEFEEVRIVFSKQTLDMPIGIHREPIGWQSRNVLQYLNWQWIENEWVSTITIESESAASVRLHMQIESSGAIQLVFFELNRSNETTVIGETELGSLISTNPQLSSDLVVNETTDFWSPSARGSVLGIELRIVDERVRDTSKLTIKKLAHRYLSTTESRLPNDSTYLYDSSEGVLSTADCSNEYVACHSQSISGRIADSAAVITYERDGASYLCSAVLINDSAPGNQHFMLTANHCVETNSIAATVEAEWFWQFDACNSQFLDPRFIITRGGAQLLASSNSQGMSLLKLNQSPPSGAYYAGLSTASSALAVGTTLTGIHHPRGQYKEFWNGVVEGIQDLRGCDPGGTNCKVKQNRLVTRYQTGIAFPGSSGSGIFNGTKLVAIHEGGSIPRSCSGYSVGNPISGFYSLISPHINPQPSTVVMEPPPLDPEQPDPPEPDDHGNTRELATVIKTNSRTNGRIATADDRDYFQFRLSETSDIKIQTLGGTDTTCMLESGLGVIVRDDDGGEDHNCRIRRRQQSGAYWIAIDGFGVKTGNYELSLIASPPPTPVVTDSPPDPGDPNPPDPPLNPEPPKPPAQPDPPKSDDHGDSREFATVIETNSRTNGRIGTADDRDYFQFRLPEYSEIKIQTLGQTDTTCVLENASGVIIRNDDGGEGRNCLILKGQQHGEYWIAISGYAESTGSYQLSLISNSHDISDTKNSPREVAVNSTLRTRLGNADDYDHFEVVLDSPGTLSIYSKGTTDTIGCWFDDKMERKKAWRCDDDSGEGRNFLLQMHVAMSGSVLFRVYGYRGTTGDYELEIDFSKERISNEPLQDSVQVASTAKNWIYQIPGTLSSATTEVYRIEIFHASRFVVVNRSQIDTHIQLVKSPNFDTPIAEAISSRGDSNLTLESIVVAGTYYVLLQGATGRESGEYQLRLELSPISK